MHDFYVNPFLTKSGTKLNSLLVFLHKARLGMYLKNVSFLKYSESVAQSINFQNATGGSWWFKSMIKLTCNISFMVIFNFHM